MSAELPFEALPFGAALARLMHERGVSYRQLASRTDLSGGYLNHLVHGARPVPANDVIERIARALEVDPVGFRDYRLRAVWDAIRDRPEVIERLYAELVGTPPVRQA